MTTNLACLKCYGTDLRMDSSGSDGQLPTATYTCRTCGAGLRVQMTRDASDEWYEEVSAKARALVVRGDRKRR